MGLRLEALKRGMEREGLDLMLITGPDNCCYFTNFRGGYLLVPIVGEPILAVGALDFEEAKEVARGVRVMKIERLRRALDFVSGLVQAYGLKGSVGLDGDLLLNSLRVRSPDLEFKNASRIVADLRAVKSFEEVDLIKKAVQITEEAVRVAVDVADVGLREVDVAAEVEYTVRRGGGSLAFETIVASGPRSAYPHGAAGERRIVEGDLVVVDVGARYLGYNANITRTLIIGDASPSKKRIYEVVLKAQELGFSMLKDGVKASDVDKASREYIVKEGYGDFFIHGLGHGIGLSVHENPSIYEGSQEIIKEGFVVTIEPAIYLPNVGGVRIEDDVLIKKEGYELLTKLERDLKK